MRVVTTAPPSFPDAPSEAPLSIVSGERWQVLCGDEGHWRVGIYSPTETSLDDVEDLELHDCPELFVLTEGAVSLALFRGGRVEELPLEPGVPVMIKVPHSGFCPHGPHTGKALVVERDDFETVYRTASEWREFYAEVR